MAISHSLYTAGGKGPHLDAGILAHGALEGLLISVFVTPVPDQFSAGDKCHVAVPALVGPGS